MLLGEFDGIMSSNFLLVVFSRSTYVVTTECLLADDIQECRNVDLDEGNHRVMRSVYATNSFMVLRSPVWLSHATCKSEEE